MSLFDAIVKAPVYGSGNYFEEGKYRLTLEEVKMVDSQRKQGTKYLIVACRIDESTAENLNAGDSVTWRVDMTQASGPSNCKQFAVAVGKSMYEGFSEDHVTSEFLGNIISDNSEAKGVVIDAEAITIKTRAGNDFTKVIWRASGEAAASK
tara:strand:+ start:143 stop:595 length:453 start_codon:yes stop_codon:yes gene_type:complete